MAKAFEISSTADFNCGTATRFTLVDGTVVEENFRQDEAAWAKELFGDWFQERELNYGRDYWLERCKAGKVKLCFKDAGEALWFQNNYKGDNL